MTDHKIQKLTPEQEAYLPVFRKEYLNIATSPKRIDRKKLESGIEAAYKVIGKKKPLLIILRSPREAMMAIKFMEVFAKEKTGGQLRGQLRGQLYDQLSVQLIGQLYDQLRDQLIGQLSVQLIGQLRGQLYDQLYDQLRGQLIGQLYDQLRGQLIGQLYDQLYDQLSVQLIGQPIWNSNFLWGSQDLYWIAWGKFAEHIGVKLNKKTSENLEIMDAIGSQCEWWWPYEGICFASEKPISIKWDDTKRLHSENGSSVEYADGYSLYSWHGTSIPENWVGKDSVLTPQIALTWQNVEQRRCACEILGWVNVLEHPSLNPKIINQDEPHIGTLIEVDLPDAPKQWFIKYQCGTGRWFAESVNDKKYNTALLANAAGNGYRGQGDPESFIPFIRT